MSLIENLRDLFRDAVTPEWASADHDQRLTVASLLVLVAQADGKVMSVEERGLSVLLQTYFGLSEDVVARLLDRAAEIGSELDPATSLADRILQDVAFEDRANLLVLAYRVAAIDGHVHEFEDDLIWRIGRLLTFNDADIVALKIEALKNLSPDEAHG